MMYPCKSDEYSLTGSKDIKQKKNCMYLTIFVMCVGLENEKVTKFKFIQL